MSGDDNGYRACKACGAAAGTPCWARTGGGPQALPDVLAEHPHGGRERRSATAAPPPAAKRALAKRAAAPPRSAPAWLRPRT